MNHPRSIAPLRLARLPLCPLCLLCLLGPLLLVAPHTSASDPPESVRIGVSMASFGRVNRSDATAALKAWAAAVSRDLGVQSRFQVQVFDTEDSLTTALHDNQVEAATMTLEGFHRSGIQPNEVFLSCRTDGFEREFVLLTRQKSPHEILPNLRNTELALHVGTSMSIASAWLEVTLHDQNLGRSSTFFRQVQRLESASKCVLRVFFDQSDACLVTRNAFETACELNPQLKSSLRPIAVSPPLVPSLFFFRPNYDSPTRAKVEYALEQLHASPAGQQLLTVYMATRMQRQPANCLDPTRQLLTRFLQLPPPPATPGPASEP